MTENVYRGLATLIDRGFEIVVHADLATRRSPDGSQGWGGHLQADREEDFELMAEVGAGRLRLPDGREADFDGAGNEIGSGGLLVSSGGPAPF
ncbi:hypothetical protein [Kitasatospora sp. GAS1066B]|uniref:hypothetical protein n=1 Tax=Kitasatospora sp. GAS1066B TaxID=3156271 RepID=UPI0035136A4C